MDVKMATTLASVVLLTFMLTGGYYLQVSNGIRISAAEMIAYSGSEVNKCQRERIEMKDDSFWLHEKLLLNS